MLANLSILNSHISQLNHNFPWVVRREGAIQLKASEVEGYGDYDTNLLGEQFEALSKVPVNTAPIPDIAAEEFEAIYSWFLS